MKSRFNPQNVAATLHTVLSMIERGLWTQDEISIITPYREQAALYRKVLRQLTFYRLQVFTADSVQGRENKCTIFDMVLAYARIGGWGFIREGLRLNVAISRSCDHFVLVCDLAALDPSERHLQQLEELEPKERQERERNERELGKHIRGLFNYFERKQMIKTVKAEILAEIKYVDMTAVTDFRRRHACRNCQQLGHRAEQCTNPKVENVKCHGCGEMGHRKSDCPDKLKNTTCYNCGDKGHRKPECPNAECKRCGQTGHKISVCGQPDDRVCNICNEKGHIGKDCPSKPRSRKRQWHFPYESSGTAEAVETAIADSQEPAPMPTMSAAWENFKFDDPDLDPAAVVESLLQSDMHSDEDEEESEGKGKGKIA